MNTEQVKGAVKDVVGKGREKAGESVSSDSRQAQGSDQQLEGKEKEKAKDNIDVLNP